VGPGAKIQKYYSVSRGYFQMEKKASPSRKNDSRQGRRHRGRLGYDMRDTAASVEGRDTYHMRADDVDLVLLRRANNNGGVLGNSALGALVEAVVLLHLLLPVCVTQQILRQLVYSKSWQDEVTRDENQKGTFEKNSFFCVGEK
jgi:hypothetical protein